MVNCCKVLISDGVSLAWAHVRNVFIPDLAVDFRAEPANALKHHHKLVVSAGHLDLSVSEHDAAERVLYRLRLLFNITRKILLFDIFLQMDQIMLRLTSVEYDD